MVVEGGTGMANKSKRSRAGALIACMAAPVTAIAALSTAIAPVLGISERTLLAADIGLAGALFVIVVWTARR
jgi:hypothetical protein